MWQDILWAILYWFGIFFLIVFTLVMIYVFAEKFMNEVYIRNKPRMNASLSFTELLSILATIINTEIEAYEEDIFTEKGNITNQNFENYYKDITNKIIENISPEFESNLKFYLTEEAIYKMIARSVKNYLTKKVTGVV